MKKIVVCLLFITLLFFVCTPCLADTSIDATGAFTTSVSIGTIRTGTYIFTYQAPKIIYSDGTCNNIVVALGESKYDLGNDCDNYTARVVVSNTVAGSFTGSCWGPKPGVDDGKQVPCGSGSLLISEVEGSGPGLKVTPSIIPVADPVSTPVITPASVPSFSPQAVPLTSEKKSVNLFILISTGILVTSGIFVILVKLIRRK